MSTNEDGAFKSYSKIMASSFSINSQNILIGLETKCRFLIFKMENVFVDNEIAELHKYFTQTL
jgi:oligoribonuclease NrnB/cAMP/cGMP phosphodiesterase (DHH superfamily)